MTMYRMLISDDTPQSNRMICWREFILSVPAEQISTLYFDKIVDDTLERGFHFLCHHYYIKRGKIPISINLISNSISTKTITLKENCELIWVIRKSTYVCNWEKNIKKINNKLEVGVTHCSRRVNDTIKAAYHICWRKHLHVFGFVFVSVIEFCLNNWTIILLACNVFDRYMYINICIYCIYRWQSCVINEIYPILAGSCNPAARYRCYGKQSKNNVMR